MARMPRYIYSSPSEYDNGTPDYGGRVPTGRRGALVAPIPYANVHESIGPSGPSTSFNAHNLPITQPGLDDDLPSERRMRMQNEGIVSRGPSPQFAASPMGQQRFGDGPAQAPTAAPFAGSVGTLGGYGATPSTPAAPSGYLDKAGYERAKDNWTRAHQTWSTLAASQAAPEDVATAKKEMDKWDKTLKGESPAEPPPPAQGKPAGGMPMSSYGAAGPPAPTAATAQPANPAMPFTNPQTGSPQMRAPIAPPAPLPMSGQAYDARLQQARQTAADSLDANPGLGTSGGIPAPTRAPLSVPPGGMGNSPADYRQASGQAYANQASINRTNESQRQQTVDRDAAQFNQNVQARRALDERLKPSQGQPQQQSQPFAQPAAQTAMPQASGGSLPSPGRGMGDFRAAAEPQASTGEMNANLTERMQFEPNPKAGPTTQPQGGMTVAQPSAQVPPHALQVAQQAGGQVQPDGSMVIGQNRYTFGKNAQGVEGWIKG